MSGFNLNDMESVMTLYLIFNFVIALCLIYLTASVIYRIFFRKKEKGKSGGAKNKKRKKDFIEFFWEKDKSSEAKTIVKRIFLIALMLMTAVYLFNLANFVSSNIDVVKRVFRME